MRGVSGGGGGLLRLGTEGDEKMGCWRVGGLAVGGGLLSVMVVDVGRGLVGASPPAVKQSRAGSYILASLYIEVYACEYVRR